MPGPVQPWSHNLNAPKIPRTLYLGEKSYFAGVLIGAIFYGVVVILFCKCVCAFFDPVNRARGIKWGLVAHATAMFLFATIYIAMSSNIQSISFIDNREFPASVNGVPGPVGYQFFIASKPIGTAPTPMVLLNGWLADGLLLYRCYVIYAKNIWAVILPCLMYLASLGTGILFNYKSSRPGSVASHVAAMLHYSAPFLSISLSLNILLTLMIVARLILHRRNIRNAMGDAAGAGGLYKATATIFIESSGLFALSALLYIGTWGANSYVQYIFLQILAQTEVIAQFFIILRVANQRAITSGTTTSGKAGSIHFMRPGRSASGSETLPNGYPMSSVDASEGGGIGVDTTVDFHHAKLSGSEGSWKA